MVDRPIIFSSPMVRALLSKRKTQTRRLASSPLAKCRPGDRLWVRETWAPTCRIQDDRLRRTVMDDGDQVIYPDMVAGHLIRWRPSIHMPRWASRLTLVVSDVRFQRLQEISEDDAWAEGVIVPDDIADHPGLGDKFTMAYVRFWNSLYGNDAWAVNPPVVALTFAVHYANIDGGAV
ncbi:hypothetical protein [Magnetospirillum molischianum]|uniref:ASCH domain-containing protein n=1 Tax=Magnetospirillum molischianum DSM 120 TaxID=1150626 RepID=H8FVR9_MAGML|nr:hypothetical protein [Magnetospirillum molischianum]CCG42457.1 conserved hypothetical protein [Magnetospirillum molischianum DSM 120]